MRYRYHVIAGLCTFVTTTAALAQVVLPEGFEIVEIDAWNRSIGVPSINNCGEVAFDKQLGKRFASKEMYLYDNGRLTRLTNDDVSDRSSHINDAGVIVWIRKNVNGLDTQFVRYEDGELIVIDENSSGVRQGAINNHGHIAWGVDRLVRCPYRVDMMLWDGESIRQISDDQNLINQSPDINDHLDVVWGRADFCVNPWDGDILLWSDDAITILPSDFTQVQVAEINNPGQVVWNSPAGIESWEAGETELLIEGGSNPYLNNRGDIFFLRWHDESQTWDAWLYLTSDGEPTLYRLSDEDPWNVDGDINDWGEVAWHWVSLESGESGARLLRRIRTGDSEFDDDIDQIDYATFANCMTGPGRVDRLCDCRFLDIDYDGDLDLGDFALFQNAFTGN